MLTLGIDSGSTTTKGALFDGEKIVRTAILPTSANPKDSITKLYDILYNQDVAYTVSTGYGRALLDQADKQITEITCHARGGRELAGGDCTIIDVGGQDTKVIQVSNGVVMDFLMNDKCSAGTGKFLEIMANRLGITLDELFDLAKQGKSIPISSLCTVFAESEVISYIGEGRAKEDIAAGVIESVVAKVAQLAQRQALADTIILTGGLSHSTYFTARLSERLGKHVMPAEFGRFAGALGAAYLAEEKK